MLALGVAVAVAPGVGANTPIAPASGRASALYASQSPALAPRTAAATDASPAPASQSLAPARTKGPTIVAADCPGGYLPGKKPGDPVVCLREDKAPPGVDVKVPVPTRVLAARAAPLATLAAGSNVACEGDGVSGYRVQALYVVEAGKTNRFSALNASLKLWAAGVDDVFNRSAAKTGGVRNVRFVTEGTSPSCTAMVTPVTVPAGSLASLSTEIAALSTLGFNRADRKYLLWTDTSVYCGIATLYMDDRATQDNYNNGYAPLYARVDTGCWGRADHYTEAHELTHTMGAVQLGAPHATAYGHCTDESDLMCYSDNPDGVTPPMVQVCPLAQEQLLDCNNDDYFSTRPATGSWLATHWNVARSRWLVGGGDATPSAPETVSAFAGDRQAFVSWRAAYANGSPVTGYTLTASPGGATANVSGTTTSTVMSGLTNGTSYTFTVSAANAVGTSSCSPPSAPVIPNAPGPSGGFTGTTPARVLDTREGLGAAKSKLGAGGTVTLAVPSLPTGATAVALNVTVTGPTAASYLTVYPGGQPRPTASNLNFVAGQTTPNMVVVPLGPQSTVTFFNAAGTVDVVADVLGYFAPATGGGFTGTTPARVLDTREGLGAAKSKLGAGGTVTLAVPSLPTGATAVALNVTVTGPTAASYLTVYPGGQPRPTASNLNFVAGQTTPNMVVVPLGPQSTVTFFNAAGSVDVIADVLGYFAPETGGAFTGRTPARVLDTRDGLGAAPAKLGAGQSMTLTVLGLPAGTTAVALNVTVTGSTSGSYLTVYPGGQARPNGSNLNYVVGQTIPNMVLVPLGPADTVTFFNAAGTVDVIADVLGYSG